MKPLFQAAFTSPTPLPSLRSPRRATTSRARSQPKHPYLRPRAAATAPQPVSSPPFDWNAQWYPAALLSDLDPTAPTKVTILSKPLVIWRAKTTWSIFHDRCPHRFAALSEGRISSTGTLECRYHGWQFSAEGNCTRIPQRPTSLNTPAPSTPACATALPTIQSGPLLFVWLGSSPPPPDLSPAVVEGDRATHILSSYQRVLPLCFTTLLQNVLDPAHIHFAHHEKIGHRSQAAPIPIRILTPSTPAGFRAQYANGNILLTFRPPALVKIETIYGLSFFYYAVPITAGLVRTFAIRGAAHKPPFLQPAWLDHLRRNSLIEDDLQLMVTQEAEMRRVAAQNRLSDLLAVWSTFHMPTTSDRLIVEMRRWLTMHAPPEDAPWFAMAEDSSVNVEKFHTRFEGHIAGCAACSSTLRRLKALEAMLKIGVGLAIGACLSAHGGVERVCELALWYCGLACVVTRLMRWGFEREPGGFVDDLLLVVNRRSNT